MKSFNKVGIKWRLFGYFVFFVAVILSLLWIFQTVLLDRFYKSIKFRSVETSAQAISRNIDNEDLDSLVARIAQSSEVCISIYSSGGELLSSADILPDCVIHKMPSENISRIYERTKENGGERIERFSREGFRNDRYNSGKFIGRVPPPDIGMLESIIYTRIVTAADGSERMIMLNTTISPVSATVETLRIQLIYITVILLILSLLIAFLISKRIAKPIIKINASAKELARGNYAVYFDEKGYREISELGSTLNFAAHELSTVENLRRELIANISHDLRTPLTLIAGYGEAMRDIPGENTPENVQIIIDEANHLSALVSDMLDLSKLQSGAGALKKERFCLTESVRSILKRYQKLIDQEGYSIRFINDGEAFVLADEIKISQVLYNLINNAVNYTGEDKSVIVREEISGGFVRIEVIDTGDGIDEKQLPYIWDRYYKVDKIHKRAAVGSGLGLSIVKSILELHGAKYGVLSTKGQGSVFWFALPVEEDPEI